MKPNPVPVIAILLLLCSTSPAQTISVPGQEKNNHQLLFRNATFVPEKNIQQEKLNALNSKVSRNNGKGFAVMQFDELPGIAERLTLSKIGIELLEYIPNNAYTVTFTGALDESQLLNLHVRSVFEPVPELKMESNLAYGNLPVWAVKIPGTIDCWISFPKTFTDIEIQSGLRSLNFDVLSSLYKDYRILHLRIAANRLRELASLPFIEYVQPAPRGDVPLNNRSAGNARANILGSTLPGERGLTGNGVVIGIGDNADPLRHIDFSDRIINRASISGGSHGVHVIGTASGAGIILERFMGFAPKSTVIAQSFSNVITYTPVYVQDHGMVITNNSYGNVTDDCLNFGYYDLYSRVLDRQTTDLPNLLHVFSAGNSGSMNCGIYAAGYGTVLSGYQSAKNVITVGATNGYDVIAPFSSKGPVQDGRIKPEIMAQGDTVWSAWPVNIHSINRGTSMAAPAVSGGLALLYERYRALHGGSNPKNALMKAVLLNGATDLGNPGPDFLRVWQDASASFGSNV
jgi:subtilisin family serine protease